MVSSFRGFQASRLAQHYADLKQQISSEEVGAPKIHFAACRSKKMRHRNKQASTSEFEEIHWKTPKIHMYSHVTKSNKRIIINYTIYND